MTEASSTELCDKGMTYNFSQETAKSGMVGLQRLTKILTGGRTDRHRQTDGNHQSISRKSFAIHSKFLLHPLCLSIILVRRIINARRMLLSNIVVVVVVRRQKL